jgi:hypothetical protein
LSLTEAEEGTRQRSHCLTPQPSWRGGSPTANGPGWSRHRTWRCVLTAESTWGRGPPGSLPQTPGGRSDPGRPTAPSLRGMGLCMSMAPGLNGVTEVAVIVDPVSRGGGTPRRKVTPSLLLRLSAPGPWSVGVVVEGVIAAPRCLRGVRVKAPPIGSGRHLGWSGENGVTLRG